MEINKRPASIKLMYWITIIGYWLFIVATLLATVLSALMFLGVMENLQLQVGIPVIAELKEVGTLDSEFVPNLVNVELNDITGRIQFLNTPVELARIYSVFMMTIMVLALYILVTFKRFITNVYNGVYFSPKNISQLKHISYTVVLIWIFVVFYGYFQYFFIANNLVFDNIEFTSNVEVYPGILIFALVIWVLSHIFQKGSELQEEQNLTV